MRKSYFDGTNGGQFLSTEQKKYFSLHGRDDDQEGWPGEPTGRYDDEHVVGFSPEEVIIQ